MLHISGQMQLLVSIHMRKWGILFLLLSLFSCRPENISPEELISIPAPQGQFLLFSPDDSKYFVEIIENPREGSQVEYVKILVAMENGRSFEFRTISQFPARVAMSLREVVSVIEDTELEEVNRGSNIKLNFLVKESDQGEEPHTVQFLLPSICPEPGLAGSYIAISSGTSGPGGGGKFSEISSTIEITAISDFEFEISDATGGVFKEIWAAKAEKARLIENCRKLDFPTFIDQFDDEFSGEAALRSDGRIELNWRSSYGDNGKTIFRKQ
ncbi:MAG: hypothetical protein AAFR87_28620 [Bacteroidota bacterium]